MSLPRYPKYKDSGVEWLGEVPEHWDVNRLKHVADVFPSNVDKHTKDGEQRVRLCNYTDVYYNETITDDLELMIASATDSQIAKFQLRAGDTIITKDSETADDIAVPTYVPDDLPGIICGYHLSMIRPGEKIAGAFVKRLFDSLYLKACVEVRANGLTRVGLGQYALDNLDIPLPPTEEQAAIASFLDRETGKIDALVDEQRRLIELLKEKRQAVISHAVTKGLDPDVAMKDSGVEWLGEVPEHWEVMPVKRFLKSMNPIRVPLSAEERSFRNGEFPYYGASGIIDFVDDYLFDGDLVLVSEDGANLLNRASPISFVAHGKYWVNNHAHILMPPDKCCDFWAESIESINLTPFITGSAQPKFTAEALANLVITAPPTERERSEIQLYFLDKSKQLETLKKQATHAITLLQERRTALISAAVTGKIDVRTVSETQTEPGAA